MPITTELLEYIKKSRQSGLSDDVITGELLKAAFDPHDIAEALSQVPVTSPAADLQELSQQTKTGQEIIQPAERKSRVFWAMLCFLIIILIIIGGGFYYFQSTSSSPASTSFQEPSDETITVLTRGSTADWNIYTNPELGVFFKYPKDWEPPEFTDLVIAKQLFFRKQKLFVNWDYKDIYSKQVVTLDDFIKNLTNDSNPEYNYKKSIVSINGKKFVAMIDTGHPFGVVTTSVNVFISKNNSSTGFATLDYKYCETESDCITNNLAHSTFDQDTFYLIIESFNFAE